MTRAYPAYRDSGVEWLGEVPEGWNVGALKRFGRFEAGAGFPHEEQGLEGEELPFFKVNAIGKAYRDDRLIPEVDSISVETAERLRAQIFPKGTIVFAKIGAAMLLGRIRTLPCPSCIDNNMMGFIVDGQSSVDFFRQLMTLVRFDFVANPGTVPSLNEGQIANISVAVPPLPEQTAIAAFLDRETAKIDGLVAEQRRLIDLLREKRQAVISHAVTRGLNPTAPLKPSGIDWLGDVPEGWRVAPLKMVASVQTGIAKGKDTTGLKTVEVPYLRVANVQDGYVDLTEVATIEIPADSLDRYTLKPGDVLMNEGGDFDKLGRGHVWHGQIDPCIHQNHVFAVRPHGVSSDWLNVVTGTDYAQFFFMGRSKQSTNLASISSSNLMELPVLIPTPQEQAAILAFLAEMRTKLDALTATAETAISLLQERRAALISAAVTGKIDLRPEALRQEVPA